MHWQFVYPKRIAFDPSDYENAGLGGSEASLVLLTRALVARGHEVEVFNCCFRPGEYEGVRWRMLWEIDDAREPDVSVAVRFEEAAAMAKTGRRRPVFWMLDDRASGPLAFAKARPNGTVVIASGSMRRRLEQADFAGNTVEIPHPIEVSRYPATLGRRSRACLFSSMPNRGLDVALKLWPWVREKVPDAELWVTSGWELWGYTQSEAEDRWRPYVEHAHETAGVRLFRAVRRDDLVTLQSSAWCSVYPCRFPEMFCVSAAESCAAGTPLVASAMEAISERVLDQISGILIEGSIEAEAIQRQFATEVIRLLSDPVRRNSYGDRSRASVERMDPDRVASDWEALVRR